MQFMYRCICCCGSITLSTAIDPSEAMCSPCMLKKITTVNNKVETIKTEFEDEIDRLKNLVKEALSPKISHDFTNQPSKGYM